MKGAKELGMNTKDVFLATKRLGNQTFGRLLTNRYNPYKISNNIIASMALNSREIGLPNPYREASSAINSILRQLYQINLKAGAEWPEIINPLRPVGAVDSKDQSSITPNIPVETSEVSEEVVQTSALPSNVNQNTGLTGIEEALLSNEEKAMRLRERGMNA
jgi:hypothetical protein